MKRKFRKLYRKRTYVQWVKSAAAPIIRLWEIPAFQYWVIVNAIAPLLFQWIKPLLELDMDGRMLLFYGFGGCLAGANVWGAYKFPNAKPWFIITIPVNFLCHFFLGFPTIVSALQSIPFWIIYLNQ